MADSLLRTVILPDSLTKEPNRIVIVPQYTTLLQTVTDKTRTRSPYPAKNLNEFYLLVYNAIKSHEQRTEIIDEAKVHFTEEDIDYPKDKNIIVSFSLVQRLPGSFSSGPPFQGDVANWRPQLREEINDPNNPGYKRAIFGYWHDNEVKFTVWARTNKVANGKALWFENIMQEYSWYFMSQGVARLLFLKRSADMVIEINSAKLYGRPMHYFVRTETLTSISQKTIEQITIGSQVENNSLLNVT